MQKRSAPRQPRRRPTLASARQDARRVADEAWAWQRLHDMLTRIVRATILGIRL